MTELFTPPNPRRIGNPGLGADVDARLRKSEEARVLGCSNTPLRPGEAPQSTGLPMAPCASPQQASSPNPVGGALFSPGLQPDPGPSAPAGQPIKVLHLSAADTMLRPILRDQLCHLRRLGYRIHTASIDGPQARRLRDEDGFPWTALPLSREIAPLQDWRALRFIEQFCRKEGFQIVHTHTPKGNLLGQWGARRAGAPIVLQTLHGFYFHEGMGWFQRQPWIEIERFSARHSELILSQNPEDVETAVREGICPREKVRLLGNGIDLQRFRPGLLEPSARLHYRAGLGIPGQALVVGMCGRFVAEKGFPEFLAAGRGLLARHPSLHLLLVGHRLESERAREVFSPQAAGIDPARLTVLEDREDMPQLYACMDLHVLPSHREGFPRVLMEGSACGLAQVATAIRGCRQVLAEGRTGFLVPVGSVQALEASIERLLLDPELRGRMGRQARVQAEEEFDQRRVFQTVAVCYAHLLAGKGLRGEG